MSSYVVDLLFNGLVSQIQTFKPLFQKERKIELVFLN